MNYIDIQSIGVKPILMPYKKGEDKWYELIFYGWDEVQDYSKVPAKPLFMTVVPERWLKGQTNHLMGCVREMRDAKPPFSKHHYEKFGRKVDEAAVSQPPELERYVG